MQQQNPLGNTQQEPFQLDNNAKQIHRLPITAPLGVQYTALASITSTDSVLRDLPSLNITFQDFKLIQSHDNVVREIMSMEVPSQDSCNFQYEYLKSIISNASVENM
ncbi:hypothetical protein BGZ76_007026 [Entomortierella beljakovae]|nr:hypothetical protein BGZ76_007026 [Entomortierella beljakovae]